MRYLFCNVNLNQTMRRLQHVTLTLLFLQCLLLWGCTSEDSTTSHKNISSEEELTVNEMEELVAEVETEDEAVPETDLSELSAIMQVFHLTWGKDRAAFGDDFEFLIWEVKDEQNGYLKFTGAIEGWMELVIWKKEEGYLVGEVQVGCGPVCDQTLNFYHFDGSSVTPIEDATLLPLDALSQGLSAGKANLYAEYPEHEEMGTEVWNWFELPQKGRDIQVKLASNEEFPDIYIATLRWNGIQFEYEDHRTR